MYQENYNIVDEGKWVKGGSFVTGLQLPPTGRGLALRPRTGAQSEGNAVTNDPPPSLSLSLTTTFAALPHPAAIAPPAAINRTHSHYTNIQNSLTLLLATPLTSLATPLTLHHLVEIDVVQRHNSEAIAVLLRTTKDLGQVKPFVVRVVPQLLALDQVQQLAEEISRAGLPLDPRVGHIGCIKHDRAELSHHALGALLQCRRHVVVAQVQGGSQVDQVRDRLMVELEFSQHVPQVLAENLRRTARGRGGSSE